MSRRGGEVCSKAKQSKALPPPGRPDCWTAAGATVPCCKDAVCRSVPSSVNPPLLSPTSSDGHHSRPVGGVCCRRVERWR